jgi:hypothetical protein
MLGLKYILIHPRLKHPYYPNTTVAESATIAAPATSTAHTRAFLLPPFPAYKKNQDRHYLQQKFAVLPVRSSADIYRV